MKITDAKALPGFRLDLRFEGGEAGVVDLSSFAGRGVFAAWSEPGVFERVGVNQQGAVEWPGEIDLCPDALYLRMTGKSVEEVFPLLRDGGGHRVPPACGEAEGIQVLSALQVAKTPDQALRWTSDGIS